MDEDIGNEHENEEEDVQQDIINDNDNAEGDIHEINEDVEGNAHEMNEEVVIDPHEIDDAAEVEIDEIYADVEDDIPEINDEDGVVEELVWHVINQEIDEGFDMQEEEGDDPDEISSEDDTSGVDDQKKKKETRKIDFDASLPSTHMYLGSDMQELHGRTIHDNHEIVMMPLFFLPGVVLMPGQTLPLNLFHPQPIAMMKRVVQADKTFGLMVPNSENETASLADVGTTCEIFSVKEDDHYGYTTMSIIATGRQRFRIISKKMQLDGVIMGKIKILPEFIHSNVPPTALLCSNQLKPNSLTSRLLQALQDPFKTPSVYDLKGQSLSRFPVWVYKLYNPQFLMTHLIGMIKTWNQNLDFSTIPSGPVEFSHWVTANLPFTNEMKVSLLEIDAASVRLRRQIKIMQKCSNSLACLHCEHVIANKNDLFSMSATGPQAAYVNPGGHVHETMTFFKATGLSVTGRPTTEYSWFPGYAWRIARCDNCHEHMGWKFTAAKRGLKLKKFWGLTRASLVPVFLDEERADNANERSESISEEVEETNALERINSGVQYESSI